jgi:hypothetical protein
LVRRQASAFIKCTGLRQAVDCILAVVEITLPVLAERNDGVIIAGAAGGQPHHRDTPRLGDGSAMVSIFTACNIYKGFAGA